MIHTMQSFKQYLNHIMLRVEYEFLLLPIGKIVPSLNSFDKPQGP